MTIMTRSPFIIAASLVALVAVAGCDKKQEGAAPSGSATTGTGAANAAPPAAAAAKKPKATMKKDDLKKAYKSEVDDMSKMKEPMDKRVAALVSKVGAPAADDGRRKTWYTLDGDGCAKVVVDTKDGSITEMTTDKADCGL